MRIVAGMDEAGYGPLLGPLVVCCWAFEVADAQSDATDLWKRLSTAVCRRPNDKKGRIAIDDSKTLKGAKDAAGHPLRHLERGVLCALGALGAGDAGVPIHDSDETLLRALSLDAAPPLPWYAGTGASALPLCHPRDELALTANRLRLALAHAGIRPLLARAFPDAAVRVLQETEEASHYELREGRGTLRVHFEVEADARHLPVALSSMTAKYLRELRMARLNAFFAKHRPGLVPTAGYVQDGRRVLAEIEPVLAAAGVVRETLVRAV